MTLTEFLLARVVEDEEMLRRFSEWSKARVLAECEAKRRIMDLHAAHWFEFGEHQGGWECVICGGSWGRPCDVACETLRLLALPYADHPDYRGEWRP